MLAPSQVVDICSAFIAPEEIVSSQRLLTGLSNDNFLIRTQQQAYLLKCYKAHWPGAALAAQGILSRDNICPAPIWLDPVNRRAAFNYIEAELAHSHITLDLVRKLAQVHNYALKTPTMDIAQELHCYHQSDVYKQHQVALQSALISVANMPLSLGFCHNDLVKENILVNSQGMYFIDFEYAQTNDVYFDLAALTVSFKLSSAHQTLLLHSYHRYRLAKEPFYLSITKLNCYKLFFLVLCIGWYEQRGITNKVPELRVQLDELIAQADF
jgi:thiamine kinase